MRSSFGGRRQPRKLGQDEDDNEVSSNRAEGLADPTASVTRPSFKSKKNRSSVRTPLAGNGTSMADEEDEPTQIFVPKKSTLSRQTLDKPSSLRKSLAAAKISSDQGSLRQRDNGPTYGADALSELRSSTPSTPTDLARKADIDKGNEGDAGRQLDLASKFGPNHASRTDSAIPSNAEIQEKKQRRARLAKEHDFIGLGTEDDYSDNEDRGDSEESNDEQSLLPYAQGKVSNKGESRLVRDDEDIAEGFEEFVDDGRIAFSRKAKQDQRKRQKQEMQAMIEGAEGPSGTDMSSEDDSERERKEAYEAAQTKAGMDGLNRTDQGSRSTRARTPPKITPLPTLASFAEKLEAKLARTQQSKDEKARRLEEIQKELADIASRKVELQTLLDEAAQNYQRLRGQAGLGEAPNASMPLLGNGSLSNSQMDLVDDLEPQRSGLGAQSRGLQDLADT